MRGQQAGGTGLAGGVPGRQQIRQATQLGVALASVLSSRALPCTRALPQPAAAAPAHLCHMTSYRGPPPPPGLPRPPSPLPPPDLAPEGPLCRLPAAASPASSESDSRSMKSSSKATPAAAAAAAAAEAEAASGAPPPPPPAFLPLAGAAAASRLGASSAMVWKVVRTTPNRLSVPALTALPAGEEERAAGSVKRRQASPAPCQTQSASPRPSAAGRLARGCPALGWVAGTCARGTQRARTLSMVYVHCHAGVGVDLGPDLSCPLVQHRGGAHHQRAALRRRQEGEGGHGGASGEGGGCPGAAGSAQGEAAAVAGAPLRVFR